jgi:hypothetical protein
MARMWDKDSPIQTCVGVAALVVARRVIKSLILECRDGCVRSGDLSAARNLESVHFNCTIH